MCMLPVIHVTGVYVAPIAATVFLLNMKCVRSEITSQSISKVFLWL